MAQKLVGTTHWDTVDFALFDSVTTGPLDACVAAITYSGQLNSGSMCHLTLGCSVRPYVDWLGQNVDPEKSVAFLAGGLDSVQGSLA